MRNKFIFGGIIVVVVLLLAAGRFSGDVPAGGSGGHGGVSSGQAVAAGNPAPDFNLQRLDGGTISLAEFKGKKPVVLDFWASWCPNCRRDMPNLNRFYEKHKNEVEVIGINLHENESVVRSYINSAGISFPIALDPSSQAARAFAIQYTNTHFLIDIDGNIVRVIPGDIREADIESLISQNATPNIQSLVPDEELCEVASMGYDSRSGACKIKTT